MPAGQASGGDSNGAAHIPNDQAGVAPFRRPLPVQARPGGCRERCCRPLPVQPFNRTPAGRSSAWIAVGIIEPFRI
ncbi:hypothetical protein WS85_06020 [Burkholderia anthina]|nr:hypothetical protein WS85_06020 [Burkholderia anthina]